MKTWIHDTLCGLILTIYNFCDVFNYNLLFPRNILFGKKYKTQKYKEYSSYNLYLVTPAREDICTTSIFVRSSIFSFVIYLPNCPIAQFPICLYLEIFLIIVLFSRISVIYLEIFVKYLSFILEIFGYIWIKRARNDSSRQTSAMFSPWLPRGTLFRTLDNF